MKRSVYIFFLILSLTSCQKCKDAIKPQEKLPDATQTGQNTFGCLVNGKIWLPSASFPLNRLTVNYYSPDHGLQVKALLKKDGINQYICLRSNNVINIGTYILNDSLNQAGILLDLNSNCNYYTDSLNIGQLKITRVDTINGIFSGEFNFKIVLPGSCGTVNITDGRFDVRE